MNRITEQEPATAVDGAGLAASIASADAWQRRFGVPWERVERAVRAVSDCAVAASRRRYSNANTELAGALPVSEVRPG